MEKKWEYNGTDLEEDLLLSEKRSNEVYSMDFGTPMNTVPLLKMCLTKIYSKVHIRKCLIRFLFRMVWKRRSFIAIASKLCFRILHLDGQRKSGTIGIEWNTSDPGPC
jgi:hypothetical protein